MFFESEVRCEEIAFNVDVVFKTRVFGENPSGSQELQRGDQGVPLSLWYESRVNSVKNDVTDMFHFHRKTHVFSG